MRNPLQEQLLKAGLVKKGQLAKVVQEQNRQRKAKGGTAPADATRVDAARLQAERVERDRALAAERNAQVRRHEVQAQIRQIVETARVAGAGEIAYRFNDGQFIRSLYVDAGQRAQLASGALVIVRDGAAFALLPRAAAEKVGARDPAQIVLDHGAAGGGAVGPSEPEPEPDSDAAYYARFKVPDDLIW